MRSMRLLLRRVFLAFVVLDIAAAGYVAFQEYHDRDWVVQVRNAVFTDFVASTDELELPPAELAKHGYLVDSPAVIAQWKQRLDKMPVYHDLLLRLKDTASTIEKAKQITLSFSRNGDVAFDQWADLEYKLANISKPYGCCSDHVEVFQALANVAGIDSLEINTGAHATSNIYIPELHKWIWIDPEFALLAKGSSGEYLSTCEMRNRFVEGEKVAFEFFGLPEHQCSKVPPEELAQNRPDIFPLETIATWGNNVLTVDGYRDKLLPLPKSYRQSIFILAGIKPHYRTLDDGQPRVVAKHWRHIIVLSIIWTLMVGTLLYPLYLIAMGIGYLARQLAAMIGTSGDLVKSMSPPAPLGVDSSHEQPR